MTVLYRYILEEVSMQINSGELYDKITKNNNSYITNYKKKVREADTDVQDMQESLDTFKSSIKQLKRFKPGIVSRTRIEDQLKKFASSYNDLKKVLSNVSDKKVQKEMEKIDDYLNDNKKLLKKVGIKISDSGKYSFDSEVFEDVEDEDLDKLFVGNDSFIQKLNRMIRRVDEKTDDAEYVTNVRRFHSITRYSDEDLNIASNAKDVIYSIDVAQENGKLLGSDEVKSNIIDGLSKYVDAHNKLCGNSTVDKTALISNILELDKTYENDLKNIGITIGNNGELEQNDSIEINEGFTTSYNSLFKSEAGSYSSQIKGYAENIFTTLLKTNELGIKVDFSL